jgi:hypothetical protein
MAKRDLSRHQEKIVKRYYEHHETIQAHKLGDLLGELWLADSDAKRDRLWGKARNALERLGVKPERVAAACEPRDVEALARLIKQVEAGQAGKAGG